ncbi:Testicular acid phosphatase, partial [Araneus ventricosus]
VFRNGMSAPRELYPNDPNHPDHWEEGLGELTIHGRRQLYSLGKELRRRYSHYITANPREVTMQVATQQKNMRSGLSMLASLYAPNDFWEFVPGLPWQPVPVFYIPEDDDKVLSSFHNCPLVVERMKKLVGQFGNETVLEMYEQQMKFWSLNSGWPIKDWNDVVKLHRILSVEYANKHNVPAWAWKYWKELECLNDYAYKINFNDKKILKVVGGPILYHLVDNAVEKVSGEFSYTKVMGFSGGGCYGSARSNDRNSELQALLFCLAYLLCPDASYCCFRTIIVRGAPATLCMLFFWHYERIEILGLMANHDHLTFYYHSLGIFSGCIPSS